MNSTMKVGDVYSSNQYGQMEVVEYVNAKNVEVKFIKSGFRTVAEASDVRRGEVKDRLAPSVRGVGYVGLGEFKVHLKGKLTPAYTAWTSMLRRCYSEDYQKAKPSYEGCTVAPEWHNFQTFAKWLYQQDWRGSHLDKDIIYPGNRVYSSDTCCLIPASVNLLLNKMSNVRGEYAIGVTFNKSTGKFRAKLRQGGKRKSLGYFSTEKEAAAVYGKAKAKYIKEVAMEQSSNKVKRGLYIQALIYEAGLADAAMGTVKDKLDLVAY